ncbi:hypothetical protein HNY73_007308 [Argiope bruennichi]|uniref:Uncharacterized protein n=2 Tax=Argiope bruennichi TaxID=94029 RepID=A0A8T0FDJ6_ARGBR|nr:hypothetical protein HNY73_007308 [Argiope bruennichi]
MSSRDKDPLKKQDTSSESSETHSDSEIDQTEENLEHLEIQEHRTKEELKDESNPLVSPNKEETLTSKCDLLSEQIAGPSGLQKPSLGSSDSSSDPISKKITHSILEKDAEGQDIDESKVKMAGADTDTTDSLPQSSLSSRAVFPFKKTTSTVLSSRFQHEKKLGHDIQKPTRREIMKPFFGSSQTSCSSRRRTYAADSANTSSDVSEMPSEIADVSREGSVYYDALETFEREQTPSYRSALETHSSEASDTNISEILEENYPLTSLDSSASISTPSGEGGNRAFIEACFREAAEREEPPSSSGIRVTDRSDLANLQLWGLAGEMGIDWDNVDNASDSQNREIAEHGDQAEESYTTSESESDRLVSKLQEFDTLFQRNDEILEESNMPGHNVSADAACRIKKFEERMQVSNIRTRISSLQRKPSSSSDSGSAADPLRSRNRPDPMKKTKVVAKKPKITTQSSSSGSTEPKSTTSDDSHRKDSPEIKSSSESSSIEIEKKPWQKPGLLLSRQVPTTSSKDSVIAEEDEYRMAPPSPEIPEIKAESPGKMETTSEKNNESDAGNVELFEAKSLDLVCSHQIPLSEIEGVSKDEEQSFDIQEPGRKAGKSKRTDARLSGSPPSDEIVPSSPNAARPRPPKIARPDKESGEKHRARFESNDSLSKVACPDSPKQGDSSTSENDYESSDETRN